MRLCGRIGVRAAPRLLAALDEAVSRGRRQLVLDLTQVDYMSSSGLRVLTAISEQLRSVGGSLVLCGVSEPVALVFDLAGVREAFAVEAGPEAAMARTSRQVLESAG